MDYLYSSGRKRCDSRYCRTHASVAQLFAESPSADFNAAAWAYVARAWRELADLKEAIAREKPFQYPQDFCSVDQSVHSVDEQPHQM